MRQRIKQSILLRSTRHYVVLGLLCGLGLSVQPIWATYGGDGTYQNPYQIATAQDLIDMGQTPADYDKHFILICDIDMQGYHFSQPIIAPMGDSVDAFSGTFNGNGHVIRNLSISGHSYIGLFGYVDSYGQISQLGIEDSNISGTYQAIGLMAGYNKGQISSCYGSGTVQGNPWVGGLVGRNDGIISNCFTHAMVSSNNNIGGGIVGANFNHVVNCYCSGTLKTSDSNETFTNGIVGSRLYSVTSSFWDAQTSGIQGEQGLATAQMMDINTYLDSGWDFFGEEDNGCREIWTMPPEGGYPVLSIFQGISSPWPSEQGVTLGLCTLSEDSNDVDWDASEKMSTQWRSTALIRHFADPDLYPDPNLWGNHVSIEIDGQVEVLDQGDLIGIDVVNAVPCRALDEDGLPISLQNVLGPFDIWHSWFISPTGAKPFTLSLQLAQNPKIPTALSQLDFLAYGLYESPYVVIDLPFEVFDEWKEIVPGFETKITEISSDKGTCTFTLEAQAQQKYLEFGPSIDNDPLYYYLRDSYVQDNAAIAFFNFDLIHSDGQIADSLDLISRTQSGSWTSLSAEVLGSIQTIRYTIAINPDLRIIPLSLYNIPIVND